MIPSDTMRRALDAYGFDPLGIRLADDDYSLPDAAYIDGLGKRFWSFLQGAAPSGGILLPYEDQAGDCDNYAELCHALAAVDHWRAFAAECQRAKESQQPLPEGSGLGFGFCWISVVGGGAHAVNVAVLRTNPHAPDFEPDTPILEVRLYEPQPENKLGTITCLNEYPKSQVASLDFCYF